MKPENVKIIQICIEPYSYFESNGSSYKERREGRSFYGLGDDGFIYRYGEHYKDGHSMEKTLGWKLQK